MLRCTVVEFRRYHIYGCTTKQWVSSSTIILTDCCAVGTASIHVAGLIGCLFFKSSTNPRNTNWVMLLLTAPGLYRYSSTAMLFVSSVNVTTVNFGKGAAVYLVRVLSNGQRTDTEFTELSQSMTYCCRTTAVCTKVRPPTPDATTPLPDI